MKLAALLAVLLLAGWNVANAQQPTADARYMEELKRGGINVQPIHVLRAAKLVCEFHNTDLLDQMSGNQTRRQNFIDTCLRQLLLPKSARISNDPQFRILPNDRSMMDHCNEFGYSRVTAIGMPAKAEAETDWKPDMNMGNGTAFVTITDANYHCFRPR